MALSKLKYKDFTWPHNPATCNINYNKRIISHAYPDINGAEHEELGSEPRTITGSGVFFGKGAYDHFKKLLRYYQQKTAGKFIHPVWGSINCRLTKLTTQEEPLPNYVEYTFEFIEEGDFNLVGDKDFTSKISTSTSSSTSSTSKGYYTVVQGDSLWKISLKFYGKGTDWKKIADANKHIIKNPNSIKIGWKLLIP